MCKLIDNIPGYSDDELIKLFHNALFGSRQTERAQAVVYTIGREWKKRGRSASSAKSKSWPEHGVLDVLGYNVGFAKGRCEKERRQLLAYVLTGELPFVHSRAYMADWGRPASAERVTKLRNCLCAFKDNIKSPKNCQKAMGEWQAVIAYLDSKGGAK